MKQYQQNVDRCGLLVDLNWYEEAAPRVGDRFDFEHILRGWEGSVHQRLLDGS